MPEVSWYVNTYEVSRYQDASGDHHEDRVVHSGACFVCDSLIEARAKKQELDEHYMRFNLEFIDEGSLERMEVYIESHASRPVHFSRSGIRT